jgi:putative OPT family oligopeptide transporter
MLSAPYLGWLFAGLTIATAIPAAVVSMGVLRLLGGGTILENNIVQTGASAGSSIAAGVIFTIPALVILGYWQDFKYSWVLAIAGLGGLLGVLFSVPLRRSMIVEEPAAVPGRQGRGRSAEGGRESRPGPEDPGALGGHRRAGEADAAESGFRMIPDNAAGAGFFGKYLGYMGTNLSPALLGVGYIVGLNIGIVVVSGSILAYNIAIPIYHAFASWARSGVCRAPRRQDCRGSGRHDPRRKIRYLGVGAMLIGGIWTLFSLRKSLLSGVKSGIAAARAGSSANVAETERDLPMKWMLIALVLFVLPLLALYQAIVGNWLVSIPMTIIMIVAGFLFVSVSAYLAGLVGSSNNPVSGITIATILFASVVLMLLLGQRFQDRRGGRDHDRRGGVLRGRGRRRQPAGPQGRLHGRCHALEATGDARHRRILLRVDHGTGAELAGAGLWHRRSDPSRFAAGTASHVDGLGGARACSAASCPGT